MKIMILDYNIIFWALILTALSLVFYFRISKKIYLVFSEEGFALIEFVRALKKTCPVQVSNGWRLLSLRWHHRCFSKSVLLPGFKNCLKLYGATCAVACSSMYAFTLISDVSKWREWEPCERNLVVRQLDSDQLKMDHFMQACHIVGIQRGIGIQSYTAFYQFLSFPSKCTKWILFWNAKQFEFMFFLLQPAVSRNSDSHCVITHLCSSNQSSLHTSTLVSQRLRNLEEFLNLSQLNIRPLSPVPPELPTPQQDHHPVFQESSGNTSSVFMLLPLFLFGSKKLKGYNLVLKVMNETPKSEKAVLNNVPLREEPVHNNLRRTVSDLNIPVKDGLRRTGSLQSPLNSTVAFPDDMEIIEKLLPIPEIKPRSVSEPCLEKSGRLIVATSLDEEEESGMYRLPSIQEAEEAADKNEMMFYSSTSDFEILDSSQQFLDSRKADYLTQGNYGASVLQTEMMLASQYDRTHVIGNRVAGGWIHSSSHKGIPVLSKSINLKVMKIFSFLCQTDIPVNYKDVWKCVKNPRFRFISDETVKTVQIIDRISDSQRLIHVYHEMNGILRKEAIDFCLLQTEREEKSSFYSVFQSIEYEKCPFMSAVIRGTLKPSGWIVQELTPKSCRVTYLVQILLNSPDNVFIHELNTLVPQSLYNLRQYITSRPK